MKRVTMLALSDFKNIFRNIILLFLTVLPIFIGTLFHYLTPFLNNYFNEYVNISSHYGFITGFTLLFPSMMFGMVIGFMILDERDEDIITYLSITPLGKGGYILYRVLSPIIITFILTYIQLRIINLIKIDFFRYIPAVILAALGTPIAALFMGAFANNKIEGMAVGKIFSIIFVAPFLGYFIEGKIRYIGGIFPPFWVTETFLAIRKGEYILFNFIIGIVITSMWIGFMINRFKRKIN